MRRSITSILLIVLLCSMTGCAATPLPEPPYLEAPDPDLLELASSRSYEELSLSGGRGSADPLSHVWIVNLDLDTPPTLVEVTDDGSFSCVIEASVGEELRLQTRSADSRSAPIDVLISEDLTLVEVSREACLRLTPSDELNLGSEALRDALSGTIELINECPGEVRIEAFRLRREEPSFGITTPSPLIIGEGGQAEIELSFAPESPGVLEEILFLEISAPFTERRPVTLTGIGVE